jgi:hypothetical protein
MAADGIVGPMTWQALISGMLSFRPGPAAAACGQPPAGA